jgi:hypothetical protein
VGVGISCSSCFHQVEELSSGDGFESSPHKLKTPCLECIPMNSVSTETLIPPKSTSTKLLDSVRNFYLQEDTKHFGLMKSTKTAMQTTTKKQTNGLNEIIGLAQHFLTNGCKRLSWTV